jgi:hypothetical protein
MAAQFILPDFDRLKRFEPLSLLTGVGYFDQTYYLPGPLPWFIISGSITVATAMVLVSIIITLRRDF